MELIDILVKKGALSGDQAVKIKQQVADSGESQEAVLQTAGISSNEILAAKGEYFNVPTRSIGKAAIPFEILRYIPEESAAYYHLLPLALTDGFLEVGIVDPENLEA
ncbi:MAG TPA: hypothetical protein VEC13_02510, partial [Candidatus Paceibacterota bacterium]|nr:hypothetical protein [Candidatus Paceibacterota bacterium]